MRFLLATGLLLAALSSAAAPARAVVDKAKLEAYIRYAEGYTPMVKIAIDDPTDSDFPGFSRVVAHLTLGPQLMDKVYFVTADGQRVVNGSLWDFKESPFADNISHLPKSGPSFGPPGARVTLIIFSDFQCPYCREFAKTMREKLPQKYPKDVRVVFEDYPIAAIHKWAVAGAEAGRCFARVSPEAFWSFHDWVFEHQGELNGDNLRDKVLAFATAQTYDASAIGTCINSHATAGEITQALQVAQSLGVQQTPTLFINGRMISGAIPWNSLDAVVQLELNRPSDVPGPIAPRS